MGHIPLRPTINYSAESGAIVILTPLFSEVLTSLQSSLWTINEGLRCTEEEGDSRHNSCNLPVDDDSPHTID